MIYSLGSHRIVLRYIFQGLREASLLAIKNLYSAIAAPIKFQQCLRETHVLLVVFLCIASLLMTTTIFFYNVDTIETCQLQW
jgi:hypothetical protein